MAPTDQNAPEQSPIDLSYVETGEGPPLVILHGLFGNKRNWGAISKRLSQTFRTIAMDLRNHGDSPWDPSMTYIDMARDVAHQIEALDLAPCHLLGHSMGGKAAMLVALTRPDLIDRLIVADIPPAPRNSGLSAYVQAMQAIDTDQLSRRADAEKLLEEAVPDRGTRSFLVQNLGPQEGGGLAWKINLDVIGQSMDDIEDFPDIDSDAAFPRPALHLTGGDSDYVLPAHHAEIDRLFPLAEIEAIPNAGHWLHAEQPTLFCDAVERFLA